MFSRTSGDVVERLESSTFLSDCLTRQLVSPDIGKNNTKYACSVSESLNKGTNRPREFPEYETDRDQLVRIEVPMEIRRPCS